MSNNLPILSEEEQDILDEKAKLSRYPKLAKWFSLFMDKNNPKTFGNRTESAIQAYGLDPITDRVTAGSMGYQNFKKLQSVIPQYLESEGMSASKVIDLIVAKAVSTNNAKFTQMLAEISGVYDPKATVIQNNAIVNNTIQVTADEQKAFSNEFEQFIDQRFSKPQENLPEVMKSVG